VDRQGSVCWCSMRAPVTTPGTVSAEQAVCDSDGLSACALMLDLTDSTQVAESTDWFVDHALTPLITIVVLLSAAIILRWLAHRSIDRVVNRAQAGVLPGRLGSFGRSSAEGDRRITSRRAQRARSLGSLLKSTATGLIFGVVLVMCLAEVDVNVAPILASAGVVGLALGFGAQTLVKDLLSGVAMLLEDQYGVGDVVDLGEAVGTVEAVGLRITRLRAVDGTVWYVRNGEIQRVGNQSQNWARAVLDVGVRYDSDLAHVRSILQDVARDLWHDEELGGVIIEEPEVWGVEQLLPDRVVVRVTLKTAPLEQWRVARAMRERIKARFDFEGIGLHTPQMVIHDEAPPGDPTPDPLQQGPGR
jgi:moderate conductance mechanosensitive channel